jgi:hypothetical protein
MYQQIDPGPVSEGLDIIGFATPVYIKCGLKSAPNIYACCAGGTHLENTAIAVSLEAVRHTHIAIELLCRKR